jgi:serine/threonine protein kinase/tetratricopeptide (TPR) repeat protein
MNAEKPSLDTLFCAAVEIASAEDRAAYLARECSSDPELRARVKKLVAAHFRAGNFLASPVPAAQLVATTEEPPIAEGPGTLIGPYKLREQIGEGGMGLVFVAEQQHPVRRKVALKVIKPGLDSRQVVARFEAERQALALMDHPHIAKVHDGGTTASGRPYFVMELVKGVPITEYCDWHRLTTRQRLELFLPVCQAVQHAHQKGVIHRDLKPSNILVTVHDVTPVVKVIDFGIAKAIGPQLTDKTLYTGLAQLIGTPLYMSPEQAGQSGLDVDTRSDVYSLGVLLYELLTGMTPFDRETLKRASYDEMRRIIREEEPPRPSTRLSTLGQGDLATVCERRGVEPGKLSREVCGELDWIVMKALEKDRNRRYESASALAADVRRYLSDEPVEASPPSTAYRLRKFARRNKNALAVAGLVLCFLVVLGSGIGWTLRDRAARRDENEQRAREALKEAAELRQEEKWSDALSAVQQAQDILDSGGGGPDLRQQAGQLRADLEMAARLEEPRLLMADFRILINNEDHYRTNDPDGADAAYATAFREYGLDVEGLDPQAVADWIRTRSIQPQLVAALDYWAYVRRGLKREGPGRLVAVARAADPDPWRNRLRDVLEGQDPKALEELAAAASAGEWPTATLLLLARLSRQTPASERVVDLLRQARRPHPGDFWINHELGYHLLTLGWLRAEEAVPYCMAAVALRPKSLAAHNNLGRALWAKVQMEEAIAEWREAIRLQKDNYQAHLALSHALRDKGQLDEAIAKFREAIRIGRRLKRDNYAVHLALGQVLWLKGQLDEAIAKFREAMHFKKDVPEIHRYLGAALRDKGQLDEAIAELQEAIRLKEDYVMAHNHLGSALQAKGRLDEAIAAYREAIRQQKGLPWPHHNLGTALRQKGQLDDAIAELQEAIRLLKEFATVEGRPLLNLPQYRQALRLDKDFARAQDNIGLARWAKGADYNQLYEAILEHWAAIRSKKEPARAYNHLGLALRDKGRLDEAVAAFREALRLQEDFAEAHSNLVQAVLHQAWQKLWADVADTLTRARETPAPEQQGGRKLQRPER